MSDAPLAFQVKEIRITIKDVRAGTYPVQHAMAYQANPGGFSASDPLAASACTEGTVNAIAGPTEVATELYYEPLTPGASPISNVVQPPSP